MTDKFTPMQCLRLWNNNPEIHSDTYSVAAFSRIVALVEAAHEIAAHPPAQPQADTISVPRDLMDSIQEILRCTDSSVDWPIIDAVDALLAKKHKDQK